MAQDENKTEAPVSNGRNGSKRGNVKSGRAGSQKKPGHNGGKKGIDMKSAIAAMTGGGKRKKQGAAQKQGVSKQDAPKEQSAPQKQKKSGTAYEGKNLDFSRKEYAGSLVKDKLDTAAMPKPRPASVHAKRYEEAFMGKGGKTTENGQEPPAQESTVKSVWEEYTRKPWFRVVACVAAGFVAILFGFQLYLRYYSNVKTEVVRLTTYSETIDVEGISIRDEVPLPAAVGGLSVGAVEDGEKVAKGQAIVNIFGSDKAAEAYRRVTEIDREIEELQGMVTASEDSAEAVTNIEKILNEQIMKLNADVYNHDLSEVTEIKNNLSYLMNKRLVAMRKVEDYDGRIEELEREKQSLESAYPQNPSSVTAPSSGYYVNALDGYEEKLRTSMLDTLTASGLSDILSRKPDGTDNGSGKLVQNFVWYLACPVPQKEAEDYLATGSVYTLILPYSETGSMQATLLYLNREENSDKVLAVFRCSSLGAELSHIRRQPVKIQIRSYEGYSVKKSALHVTVSQVEDTDEEGNVIGSHEERYSIVYVVIAGQLFSRRVDILYNGDKTVICSAKTEGSNYLAMYDEVVTEGKGLYERKIVS